LIKEPSREHSFVLSNEHDISHRRQPVQSFLLKKGMLVFIEPPGFLPHPEEATAPSILFLSPGAETYGQKEGSHV
jgi:hypothetical protein